MSIRDDGGFEVLAVVTLGSFSSEELGDIDIEPQMAALERIQQQLVTSADVGLELVDKAHVIRLTHENARIQAEVGRLSHQLKAAQNDKGSNSNIDGGSSVRGSVADSNLLDVLKLQDIANTYIREGDVSGALNEVAEIIGHVSSLQAELTKARELIAKEAATYQAHADDVTIAKHNREWYQAQADRLRAHQSAPTIKICSHDFQREGPDYFICKKCTQSAQAAKYELPADDNIYEVQWNSIHGPEGWKAVSPHEYARCQGPLWDRRISAPAAKREHILYRDGDSIGCIPESILDRNGQVALAMCTVCGKAEAELDGPCKGDEQ